MPSPEFLTAKKSLARPPRKGGRANSFAFAHNMRPDASLRERVCEGRFQPLMAGRFETPAFAGPSRVVTSGGRDQLPGAVHTIRSPLSRAAASRSKRRSDGRLFQRRFPIEFARLHRRQREDQTGGLVPGQLGQRPAETSLGEDFHSQPRGTPDPASQPPHIVDLAGRSGQTLLLAARNAAIAIHDAGADGAVLQGAVETQASAAAPSRPVACTTQSSDAS